VKVAFYQLNCQPEGGAYLMIATKYARISLILYNILEFYRIDPKPLFLETGVNPELMKQSGMRYKLNNIKNLWQKASEVIDDPCFGLKAAELWHPSNFSALGYADARKP
jgi:hypothetical protein